MCWQVDCAEVVDILVLGRGGDCGCGGSGVSMVFGLFLMKFVGRYDGCESGDRGCGWCCGVGWCGGAGMVEVVGSMKMCVGIGSVGNRGEGLVSSGGNVSVTDGGADGGGARWRDCYRFPDGIFGELREDVPYHVTFMLDINNVFW